MAIESIAKASWNELAPIDQERYLRSYMHLSLLDTEYVVSYIADEIVENRMMRGETVSPEAHLIRPSGVATRLSTDVLAVDDDQVATAIRYIRDHACDGVNVERVMDEVSLSRRVLESRFRKLIGRTPHEEIVRVQLDRVKELLSETDLTLTEIARRCDLSCRIRSA